MIGLAVNQFELSPICQQKDIQEACRRHGVFPQAYAPLAQAADSLFGSAPVKAAAEVHGVSPAQVCLHWSLRQGFGPLPRTATPSRLMANTHLGEFRAEQQPDLRPAGASTGSDATAAATATATDAAAAATASARTEAGGDGHGAAEKKWALSQAEMDAIDEMDKDDGTGRQCWDPHKVR